MSTSETIDMPPHYDADETGVGYRSLSTTAVLALVLGLASPLHFASPLYVVVPLAACASALLSLRAIAIRDGSLTGRGLALAGMALAVVFAVAPPVRSAVRDGMLQSQAAAAAQNWLELIVEDKAEAAIGVLSFDGTRRLTPEEPEGLPSIGIPRGPSAIARQLLKEEMVVKLRDLSSSGTPRIDLYRAMMRRPKGRTYCDMVFDAYPAPPAGQGDPLRVLVVTLRSPNGWLIDHWALPEDSPKGQ